MRQRLCGRDGRGRERQQMDRKHFTLTDDAREAFPSVGPAILVVVDSRRGFVKVAPITAADGVVFPVLSRAFECFRDDLREVA